MGRRRELLDPHDDERVPRRLHAGIVNPAGELDSRAHDVAFRVQQRRAGPGFVSGQGQHAAAVPGHRGDPHAVAEIQSPQRRDDLTVAIQAQDEARLQIARQRNEIVVACPDGVDGDDSRG